MTEIMVPQPDPPLLTTAPLTREIANARELIETKVTGAVVMLEGRMTVADRHSDVAIRDVKEIIETRLLGMDKAIAILQGIQDRVPLLMDEKLNHLKGCTKKSSIRSRSNLLSATRAPSRPPPV